MRVGRIRQDLSTQCSGQKGKFRPHSEFFGYFTSVFLQFSIVKIYRLFSKKLKKVEKIILPRQVIEGC